MTGTGQAIASAAEETAGWPTRQQQLQARCVFAPDGFTRFADSEVEQSIAARFEQQAALYADRLAIRADGRELNYRELNAAANRVAQAIRKSISSGPGQVSIFLSQGIDGVIAMLGILKAGKTYVPLDPGLPAARLRFIVEQSEASLILTSGDHLEAAQDLAAGRCALLDIENLDRDLGTDNPRVPVSPDDLAWIVYTSGSTGQPKGVMQTHRNALHFMRNYVNYFGVCPGDRMTTLFSFATHAANFCILLPLTNGAALFSFDLRRHNAEDLALWLERESITVACMVPTVFRRFAAAISEDHRFPNLRLVFLGGEPILKTDFDLYRRHLPRHCLFVNRLGSTEMDCIRLFFADHDTVVETSTVPAGYAVRDKHVSLLNERGEPAAAGECGEICVESRYIALGYWKRPDLTAAVFEEMPGGARRYRSGDLGMMQPDGAILNLGRKDFQVKIRGYRIEIAEIEAALLKNENVREAVVAPYDAGEGEKRLAAYIVSNGRQRLTTSQLRAALNERLPDYMVPAAFVHMESLPQAPNGKILRKALPPPSTERPDLDTPFAAPKNEIEKQLARIWSSILHIDPIGADDHLLDLGADSIRVMQIATRVEQRFATVITVSGLIRNYPTVAELARFIQST